MYVLLTQRHDYLLSLKSRWTTTLVSHLRFDAHISSAKSVASRLNYQATHLSTSSISEELEIDDVDNTMSYDGSQDMPGAVHGDWSASSISEGLEIEEVDIALLDIIVDEDEADHATEETDVCTSERVAVPITWSVPVSH